jgi:DNA polymerase III delta subunit
LAKCISEIEKLLITKEKINSHDIKIFIIPELEESIFQVIDDILNKKIN